MWYGNNTVCFSAILQHQFYLKTKVSKFSRRPPVKSRWGRGSRHSCRSRCRGRSGWPGGAGGPCDRTRNFITPMISSKVPFTENPLSLNLKYLLTTAIWVFPTAGRVIVKCCELTKHLTEVTPGADQDWSWIASAAQQSSELHTKQSPGRSPAGNIS